MLPISYARHQFPPVVIQHAVWVYLRFTLSYRDVEDLLAERGLDVSYETVRRWVLKFGPAVAQRLRRCRPRPSGCWHLDEMVARIAGETMYLWRAVDHEGNQPLSPAMITSGVSAWSRAVTEPARAFSHDQDPCRTSLGASREVGKPL
jgi:transposase-like protein